MLFLTKVVIFLGKVGTVALNIFLLDAVLKPLMIGNTTTSMVGPSIITGVISWVISSIFMHMYETAADTMVTCNAIDSEMHKTESGEYAPRFGPASFADHIVNIKESNKRNSGQNMDQHAGDFDDEAKQGLVDKTNS